LSVKIGRRKSLGWKLTAMPFKSRRATACDANAIASIYSASFRLLNFLPMLHTIADHRWFIANVINQNLG
jgi:hypothetical protein